MKNSRLLPAACVVLSALLLTGCQLAKANAGEDADTGQDRLAGAYVTRTYLDQERIYARSGGDDYKLEFEGLDGIALYNAVVKASPTGCVYTASYADEGVSDVHCYSGDESCIEGTVYFTPGRVTFYLNPIYQSPDGSVYLVSGSGMTVDGGECSQWIEETNTTTVNGVKTTETARISVTFTEKRAPESIAVVQMDADNNPVLREEFDPREVPDEIALHPGAEYIIVETRALSADGSTEVLRELAVRDPVYDGDYVFTAYNAREDGICVAKIVRVR